MNQILVTEKIYVTPELRRKKKIFRLEFFLSVFLVCILSSYYIYAEYDRNKSEEVSQQLLAQIETFEDTTIKRPEDDNVMIIVVDDEYESQSVIQNNITDNQDASTDGNASANANTNTNTNTNTSNNLTSGTSKDGKDYTTDAILTIPKIGITYPVLSETSDELLSISINKFHAPNGANEIGNYCIVGHNYKNGKMFGQLHKLKNGDIIKLKDMKYGRTIEYQVYNKFVVEPTNTKCTSQLTNGRKEVTLITCTNYGTQRLIVKCREVT